MDTNATLSLCAQMVENDLILAEFGLVSITGFSRDWRKLN